MTRFLRYERDKFAAIIPAYLRSLSLPDVSAALSNYDFYKVDLKKNPQGFRFMIRPEERKDWVLVLKQTTSLTQSLGNNALEIRVAGNQHYFSQGIETLEELTLLLKLGIMDFGFLRTDNLRIAGEQELEEIYKRKLQQRQEEIKILEKAFRQPAYKIN